MSSYRPQSPDLSQIPQLGGLTSPYSGAVNHLHPQHRQFASPGASGYTNNGYGGYAGYNPPTSVPIPGSVPLPVQPQLQLQPQQQFAQQQQYPQYDMSRGGGGDDDYLPDAPPTTRRSRRQPQHQQALPTLAPNGSSSMACDVQPPQTVKTEPSDPTLGVQLKTSFPVARIKRIMQADEDIGKVAQVTPHVVSRALELFMIRLITASAEQARGGTGAASNTANGKGPKRVLAQHMKKAIEADDTFDFLADIVSKVPDAPTKAKKEAAGSDSEDAKPKKRGKKRKESVDDA